MPTIAFDQLHEFVQEVFAAAGSEPREAELVADHLVSANLAGHDSHGVGMIPHYIESHANGRLNLNQHVEIVTDSGAIVVVEGKNGLGQVMAFEAMELGIERAKQHGLALVGLRNSFHIGRIGHWGEQCARAGLVSLHFVNVVNHEPLVAPYAGAAARFATNPVCIALPGDDGPQVMLDMATSIIALGKARVAMNKGVPAPDGTLIDASGELTTDPSVMFSEPMGALVAMGDHKGSGLAVMCELLAGALIGAMTLQPAHPRPGGITNNMLTIVIDPEALGGRQYLSEETAAYVEYLKSAPTRPGFDEVLAPGEPEQRRRLERTKSGIELAPTAWDLIVEAARSVGVGEDRIPG